jgi:hypothetical protein
LFSSTRFRSYLIRWIIGLLIVGLLGGVAIAQVVQPTHRVTDAVGNTLDVVLPITVDTIPVATTSTTLPPTTTTTTAPTTTTTAPTTTTTAPTTTTTQPGIPATQPYGTFSKENAYEFTVDDITNPNDLVGWWDASYYFSLPYQNGYGWAAGDRCAYRGVYGFLVAGGTKVAVDTQYDLNGGTNIGRFYAASIRDNVGDLYIRLSDGFMREGSRHFNGVLDRNASTSPEPGFDECPDPSEAYTAYTGPDQRPRIVFRNPAGQVVEIRDYRNTDVEEANIRFKIADGNGADGRVAVTAHDQDNGGLPGVVVYYDAMNGGTVQLIP